MMCQHQVEPKDWWFCHCVKVRKESLGQQEQREPCKLSPSVSHPRLVGGWGKYGKTVKKVLVFMAEEAVEQSPSSDSEQRNENENPTKQCRLRHRTQQGCDPREVQVDPPLVVQGAPFTNFAAIEMISRTLAEQQRMWQNQFLLKTRSFWMSKLGSKQSASPCRPLQSWPKSRFLRVTNKPLFLDSLFNSEHFWKVGQRSKEDP